MREDRDFAYGASVADAELSSYRAKCQTSPVT